MRSRSTCGGRPCWGCRSRRGFSRHHVDVLETAAGAELGAEPDLRRGPGGHLRDRRVEGKTRQARTPRSCDDAVATQDTVTQLIQRSAGSAVRSLAASGRHAGALYRA